MAVLPDQDDAIVRGQGGDRKRAWMYHQLDLALFAFLFDRVDADAEDFPVVDFFGRNDLRFAGHDAPIYPRTGYAQQAFVEANVRRQSSVGLEILWLVLFLAIFGVVAAAALSYAGSHHFNDRIAILLSGIAAGLVTIGLRAYYFEVRARRP